MDLLKRNIAPVIPEAWEQIDNEARSVFRLRLGGRHLVDVQGPHGWVFGAHTTGGLDMVPGPVKDVKAGLRVVRPVAELRTPIQLDQMLLDTAGRGARLDLEPVAEAAKQVALAEDTAIFNGWKQAGIEGIIPASTHKPLPLPRSADDLPRVIVEATTRLQDAGVEGPYALALGTKHHSELSRVTGDGGYPVRKLIERQIIDGPILQVPAIEGGLVISKRGGDFILHLGQDLSIGYAGHDKDTVELFVTESFTFEIVDPDAAVPLGGR